MAKWRRWVLGGIGTIVLGAIGSGLWERALGPALNLFGRAILTVATLGSTAAKDQIYTTAARGYHEASDQQMLIFLTSLILISAFLPLWWRLLRAYLSRAYLSRDQRPQELLKRIKAIKALPEAARTAGMYEELNLIEKEVDTLEQTWKTSRRITYGFQLLTIFSAAYLFINDLLLIEANAALTFFSQSITICRPYMDERRTEMLQSRFASIHNRGDYISVTDQLRHIASSNHLELPEFHPW